MNPYMVYEPETLFGFISSLSPPKANPPNKKDASGPITARPPRGPRAFPQFQCEYLDPPGFRVKGQGFRVKGFRVKGFRVQG